jgi:hypothetical protein
MKKNPTEASKKDLEIAREAWGKTVLLIESLLVGAAEEDAEFVDHLKGAFWTGGLSLRVTYDFHGDQVPSRIMLSTVDRKGQQKTVSTATFKATPDGKDLLQ